MKTDETYIADLESVPFGDLFNAAKPFLDRNPNKLAAGPGVVLVRIGGQDWIQPEFEIDLPPVTIDYSMLKPGQVVGALVKASYRTKHLRTRYSRAYSSPIGALKVLVPEDGHIYVIQEKQLGNGHNSFVQWARHDHTSDKDDFLDHAEYAVLKPVSERPPLLVLGAMIHYPKTLIFGHDISACASTYKEIVPAGES